MVKRNVNNLRCFNCDKVIDKKNYVVVTINEQKMFFCSEKCVGRFFLGITTFRDIVKEMERKAEMIIRKVVFSKEFIEELAKVLKIRIQSRKI